MPTSVFFEEPRTVEPEARLAKAVIARAVEEASQGSSEALKFLVSDETKDTWLELAEVDPSAVLAYIFGGLREIHIQNERGSYLAVHRYQKTRSPSICLWLYVLAKTIADYENTVESDGEATFQSCSPKAPESEPKKEPKDWLRVTYETT